MCCSSRACHCSLLALVAAASILSVGYRWRPSPLGLDVRPTDARLVYEGRWLLSSTKATADWPCVSLIFTVRPHDALADVALVWSGVRTRLNATVTAANGTLLATRTLVGPSVHVPFAAPRRDRLQLPPSDGQVEVRVRKLTCAEPFQDGIGAALTPSRLEVYGLDLVGGAAIGAATAPPARRIEIIGASDTAGYCVDGINTTSTFGWSVFGWKYSNCDMGAPGELGRRLNASVSVQAQPSMGLTQNAMARQPYLVGRQPMPVLFNRTLMSDAAHLWALGAWVPHAVVVSLGGNDYNHQKGDVPSNASFATAYTTFLDRLFHGYGANPKLAVVSVCGQGSPVEARFDPDNNRCRPCPHVADATRAYAATNPGRRVHYVFVPCDGSVVTGEGDIGCNGHKNRRGQQEVAAFLEPRLRSIMGW